MRKELFRLVLGAVGAWSAAAAAAAGTAPMPLGPPAPAPAGFLAFCARTPDQCGLADPRDEGGAPMGSAVLKQRLYAAYYWSVAFGAAAQAPASPAPSAPQPSAQGSYSWNAIFAMSHIAAPAKASEPSGPLKAGRPAAIAGLSADASRRFAAAFDLRLPAAGPSAGAYRVASLDLGDSESAPDLASPRIAADIRPSIFHLAPADAAAALKSPEIAPDRTVAISAAPHAPPSQPAWMERPAAPVTPLAADSAMMGQLDRVNRSVNRAIRYVHDSVLYGNEDYWHLSLYPGGPAAGDCKDYVLEKKRALIAAGLPAANLSIAIVATRWGETHAVLLVATDRGELVMDSLSDWIRPWRSVGYRWIERQAPGSQLHWVSIG